jgi:uncharacterized protein (TIGR02466 family)
MQFNTVFETIIVSEVCNIDKEAVYADAMQHRNRHPSITLSNNGGYQGHNFESDALFSEIRNQLPQRSDKRIRSFDIQAWLNVNHSFHWNDIHIHSDHGVLISGVYYVRTPENCGNIRMYDPRLLKGKNLYDQYYFEGRGDYFSIPVQEQLMLFFPPWLPHMVEPSTSDQERISVAFNIINPVFES